MHLPLYVTSRETFQSRVKHEFGPNALIATSMPQALRLISNLDQQISGIYLNPNDSSYSALRFLELAFLQRPTLPVFLIDEENEMGLEIQKRFFENLAIRGIIKESAPISTFKEALNTAQELPLENWEKLITEHGDHRGFLAVPLLDFAHSKTYPFDVFLEDEQKKLRLFATAGSSIESEYLAHVLQKSSWLFVSEATLKETRELMSQSHSTFMEFENFPVSWRTAETLFRAKNLLKELQKGGLSDVLVEDAHSLLSDVFQIVSHLSHSQSVQKFIERAKDCDRNVCCATLSILMCKVLKFEKNAIVEILGLASFFQDISLYHSPFGDLSLMDPASLSPEATKYYRHHSTHSADLMAQQTSIPEVTLQVMRQHHERKDRTGMPNRIGGMQLHPMAEVISLINTYLDHSLNFESVEKEVYSHYSDRIVSAFKELLTVILPLQKLESKQKVA